MTTEAGALFLPGKDRRILILTPDMSKIKALNSVQGPDRLSYLQAIIKYLTR